MWARIQLLLPALVAAGVSACASSGAPTFTPNPSMLIENQSEFVLDELRIHQDPDFMKAKNVFPGGAMKMNDVLVFYGEGDWYVTAIHPVVKGDRPYAFTTQTPITMEIGNSYELIVFDMSFRLKDAPRVDPKDLKGRPSYGYSGGGAATSTSTAPR